MLLRIDDTDASRNVEGGEAAILRDLEWLRIAWDEGPVRQSARQDAYRAAAARLGGDRFGQTTLLREDGSATYQLATVVDDIDFGITHVIRGNDHRPNEELHRRLHEALGSTAPEVIHHGLVLRPDGGKLSKRDEFSSIADLREAGIPAEAVRAYLEELGLPKHDVRYDLRRIRRLAIDAIAALPDGELAARVGVPESLVPVLRGARDLREARGFADQVTGVPAPAPTSSPETLRRFLELHGAVDARALVRELKAVGGDLKALRLALTGREHGPELASILLALPPDETLRRVDAALR
jgi:glutamyl-tRNA synthetase